MQPIQEKTYKNDFEKFLAHTNEKEILLAEIVKDIKKSNAKSLLDIGAGNGLLSIPLAKFVEDYLAVESKASFVDSLRRAGLTVIHDKFPTMIDRQFDIALSSHSISYDKELMEPFVRSAWGLVAQGGEFLIITYRGQEDDWTNLMKYLGMDPIDRNRISYNALIMLLNSLGEVKTRKVKTLVKTDSLEDMVDALSFVGGGGADIKKESFLKNRTKLEKILKSKYKVEGRFEFPFWHYFISTFKI